MKNSNDTLIRIHGAFPYDRASKTRWLLTEIGVAYEDRWLNVKEKEHEKPEYLKLHPMGRIPAAQIGDVTMFESSAICAYLADRYIDKGMAPQLSSPDRAKYQQWMYFAASTLDPIQARIMIIEDIPAGELRTTKEAALIEEFRDALGALDQALAQSSFLVGNRFSAADICVSCHLYGVTFWPELNVIIEEFPRVVSYFERMKKMPSAVTAKVFSYEA
jgi:glutathione S-transferase